jgi:SAM-dependent methyltransferase
VAVARIAGVTESSSRLSATAQAYDAVAPAYADLVRDELADLPLDRAVLAAFADYVRAGDGALDGTRRVVEVGCGPGRIAAYLHGLEVEVSGVDLSPAMIDLARTAYPWLRFDVGTMDDLDVEDGALAGVVSWYSMIHAAPSDVPGYFAEFARVLAPGGYLLLAFFESGGEPVAEFDHKVAQAFRWPIDDLAGLADEAGFAEVGRMLREPREQERFRRGHLLLRSQQANHFAVVPYGTESAIVVTTGPRWRTGR